jgi:hypothetical protein
VGLSQTSVWLGLVIVGWLVALGARARLPAETEVHRFQLVQIGLGVLTVIALYLLVIAVQQGLLGLPEMQITGNGSSAYDLRWYQDRAGAVLPGAWALSVPLIVYRLLMLAWALWLAFAVLRWLRWGWGCYSTNGVWKKDEKISMKSEG